MLKDLLMRNRSYRRFDESAPVRLDTLREMVDLCRYTGSGGNLQPLKYKLVADPETAAKVFPCLRWAGYLQDWRGPAAGERPTGYVVILRDNNITTNFVIDHGLCAQTLTLAAVERGLGACILGSIEREKLRAELAIPSHLEILLVIALGKPAEKVVLEPVKDGDIRYWRDKEGTHHVPKRSLDELVIP